MIRESPTLTQTSSTIQRRQYCEGSGGVTFRMAICPQGGAAVGPCTYGFRRAEAQRYSPEVQF